MELRQVEYAVAVVDHGGFTRAARALHVSQPSLSQGVANLERQLGVALFHRAGREVVLTAAGEAFLEPARQLLRDAEVVGTTVASLRGLESGRLDLVALPTLAVDPLAGLIGRFRVRHPGVDVRLVEPEDADAVVSLVVDGRCEVGLAELPRGRPAGNRRLAGVVAHTLLDQDILAVCPPGTPVGPGGVLAVRRLAGMALVATPSGTSTRRLVDLALASAAVSARVAVETANREALVPLVLAGAGTTFLPAPQAAEAARRGAVVAPLDPPLRRRVGVIRRPGAMTPAAAAFLALAVSMNT